MFDLSTTETRMCVVASAIAACLLWIIIWAFVAFPESGTLTAKTWKREVSVLAWRQQVKQGWRDEDHLAQRAHKDPPGESAGMENIRDCDRRVRTTRQVPDGSHMVCSSILGVFPVQSRAGGGQGFSGGGGSGSYSSPSSQPSSYPSSSSQPSAPRTPTCRSVTDYRTEPVYDDFCTYDTWEWGVIRSRTATHETGKPPYWPEIDAPVPPLEKLTREENYGLVFGERTMAVALSELDNWTVGQEATLYVSGWYGVEYATRELE